MKHLIIGMAALMSVNTFAFDQVEYLNDDTTSYQWNTVTQDAIVIPDGLCYIEDIFDDMQSTTVTVENSEPESQEEIYNNFQISHIHHEYMRPRFAYDRYANSSRRTTETRRLQTALLETLVNAGAAGVHSPTLYRIIEELTNANHENNSERKQAIRKTGSIIKSLKKDIRRPYALYRIDDHYYVTEQ